MTPENSTTETKKIAQTKIKSSKKKNTFTTSEGTIIVDGMDNVMTRIAQCCSPLKNQAIKGYLTQERIITIHKVNCTFLQKLSPERMVQVYWQDKE
jgi:GTP pyrophosphokinase